MDFLSNGIHQLYSELELDDEFFFTSNLSSDMEISMKSDYDTKSITTFTTSSSASSNLSTSSCTYNYLTNFTNDHKSNFVEEFENILTNDYGKTFDEPLQNDFNNHNIDNYLMYETEQYCKIESWENTLLDNFIELPELTDILPEKTPLCNDSCNSFLKESSDNLNKFHPLSMINNNEYTVLENELHKCVLPTVSSSSTSSLTKTLSQTQYDNNNEKITFPCTFGNCTKIYAKPAHLKAHLRRHYGDKPYICTWPNCTWKFSRSDELARHKRSHSGIKPYECIYCTKCFARSDHLAKHRKVHERKIAANKLKGIIPTAAVTVVRPGRRPKNMSI